MVIKREKIAGAGEEGESFYDQAENVSTLLSGSHSPLTTEGGRNVQNHHSCNISYLHSLILLQISYAN